MLKRYTVNFYPCSIVGWVDNHVEIRREHMELHLDVISQIEHHLMYRLLRPLNALGIKQNY